MQTKLTQKIANSLSRQLSAVVKIEAVDIEFFNSVVLKGLYIEDLHKDTLLYAKEISLNIDLLSLTNQKFHVNTMRLYESKFSLKKYSGESQNNMQFIIEEFSTQDSTKSKWDVQLNTLYIENGSFSYLIEDSTQVKPGVNFSNISLTELSIGIDDIKINHDTLTCQILNTQFLEYSGFGINQLSAMVKISPDTMRFNELNINTPNSSIQTDLVFSTQSFNDYSSFNDKVRFLSNFSPSKISSKDLEYFANQLNGMNQDITLEGIVKGKVSNLKGKGLTIRLNDRTQFIGNVDLKGLPEIEETFIYLSIKEFSTSVTDLEKLTIPPFHEKKRLKIPNQIKKLGDIKVKGKFTGFPNDFVAYGDFHTNIGSVSTDMTIKGKNDNMHYSGFMETQSFNLGRLLGADSILGAVSLKADVNGKGITKEKLRAKLNGSISAIELNQYTYQNIQLKGEISNQLFNGDLTIKDKYLNMDFIGSIDLSDTLPEFNFLSSINNISIGKLFKVNNMDSSATISSTLNIDIVGNNIDNLTGKFELYNTTYAEDERTFAVQQISLQAQSDKKNKRLNLKSDLLNAEIQGNYELENLHKSYGVFIQKYIPAIVGKKYDTLRVEEDFTFNILLKNTSLLSKLFFPTTHLDSGTSINGYYNSLENQLRLDARFTGAKTGNITIDPGFISAHTKANDLFLSSQIKKIGLGNNVYMENFTISSKTQENQSDIDVSWINESEKNKGLIRTQTLYKGLKSFEFIFKDSYFSVSDTNWTIQDSSSIKIDSTFIAVENLKLYSENEKIEIGGNISDQPKDELFIKLDRFNIHNFNLILPEEVLKLNGFISGKALIKDPYKNLIFSSDIAFKQFKINNNLMGDGTLESFWLNEKEVLSLNSTFLRGPIPTIQIKGNYFPKRLKNKLDLSLELQKTYLKLFQPYLEGTASNLRGLASGKIDIRGTFKEPQIKGSIFLQKTSFKIDYLNTSYSLSGKVIVEPDWFGFDNIPIYDLKGGKAIATGTVLHNNFKEFNTDVFLLTDKFHCLNTTKKENDLYYGQGFITGDINLGGYDKHLIIDMNVKTEKSPNGKEYTIFNIPLDNPEEVSENNFVHFINNKVEQPLVLEPETDLSGIEMNFGLEITPDAEVRIIFDEKVGDILKSKGNGNLALEINTKGDFNIFGEYVVDQGDYLFTLQNIINKRFSIRKGGNIRWNGDPYSGIMDLSAVYKLRARLSDILAIEDSTSQYTKRSRVELLLNMRNTIVSPDISFEITLPDADENTRSLLNNVLSVGTEESNENLLNKEVFSLLILNRFTPPDQGVSGTGFGATSSSELLSNQLSNWLSQISDDFDIGFTYRPGDELSTDEVELALSTQLFNDRIILDGNLEYGGKQQVNSASEQNTSALVGDFSIEYKINQDGRFRAKAFNKSNDNSFLENSNPYTQGVGISYRKEIARRKERKRRKKRKKGTEQ